MTDYSDIIRRLEEAEGPSRELDCEIMFDLFAQPTGSAKDGGPRGYLWSEDNPSWVFGIRFPGKQLSWFEEGKRKYVIHRDNACVLMNTLRVPNLTASLDATVALVEKMLPGWECERAVTASGTFIRLVGPEYIHYDFMGARNPHKTALIAVRGRNFSRPDAIALLIAMFKALQETRHDQP